jgi:hypothetical protein
MCAFEGIRKRNSTFNVTGIQQACNKMPLLGTDLENILDRFFLDYNLPSIKNPPSSYSHLARNLVHSGLRYVKSCQHFYSHDTS